VLMAKRKGMIVALFVALTSGACARGLDREEATRIVQNNSLIRATDNVSVDAISTLNDAEAVVRTVIAGTTTNLKFRRFDKLRWLDCTGCRYFTDSRRAARPRGCEVGRAAHNTVRLNSEDDVLRFAVSRAESE
jgi:hypothetical protein